jgi:hypothetical protein
MSNKGELCPLCGENKANINPGLAIKPLTASNPYICQDCAVALHLCSSCGELTSDNSKAKRISGKGYFCKKCISSLKTCPTCGNFHGEARISISGKEGCPSCMKDHIFCTVCNKWHTSTVTNFRWAKYRHVLPNNNICPTCFIELIKGQVGATVFKCHHHNHCGGYTTEKTRIEDQVVALCDDCKPHTYYCFECKTLHHRKKTHRSYTLPNDKLVCARCLSQKYYSCPICGEWKLASEATNNICAECLPNVDTCKRCGRLEHKDNLSLFNDEHLLCNNCLEYSQTCELCHTKTFNRESPLYQPAIEHRIKLCEDCRQGQATMHNYQYMPFPPIFYGKGPLFYGVENEVSSPKVDRSKYISDAAGHIMSMGQVELLQGCADLFPESIAYFKWDGSVTVGGNPSGGEIVTQPMTFDELKKHGLEKMFTLPMGRNDKCGMHIHMSKPAFSSDQLYKFLLFFNERHMEVIKIAGRDYNQYCRYTNREAMEQKFKTGNSTKKEDIRLDKADTIEVRVFAGVVTAEEYFKNIEFCDAVYHFVSEKTKDTCTNWQEFVDFVHSKGNKYENLVEFIGCQMQDWNPKKEPVKEEITFEDIFTRATIRRQHPTFVAPPQPARQRPQNIWEREIPVLNVVADTPDGNQW